MEWEWDFELIGLRSFDDFADLIKEIEKIDPQSYCCRYPVNTTGEAALPQHFVVNVVTFGKKMDSVLELLSGTVTGLQDHWDDTAEVMYLLREVLKEPKDEV